MTAALFAQVQQNEAKRVNEMQLLLANREIVGEVPRWDMQPVKAALRQVHEIFGGPQMSETDIDNYVDEYLGYMRDLNDVGAPYAFPLPSLRTDRVWHVHMCETIQYARDCDSYFGKFIHHASSMCHGCVSDIGSEKSREDCAICVNTGHIN